MESLKKFLGAVGQGFAFGVGLSIAAAGAFFVMQMTSADQRPTSREVIERPDPPASFQADQPIATKLTFENVQETKVADGRVFFTGVVKNTGKSRASGVSIEVNLFRGEKFVDQYSTYLSGSIDAGASRYFKISCGCKDSLPVDHDSYKIQAIGGI